MKPGADVGARFYLRFRTAYGLPITSFAMTIR